MTAPVPTNTISVDLVVVIAVVLLPVELKLLAGWIVSTVGNAPKPEISQNNSPFKVPPEPATGVIDVSPPAAILYK